MNGRTCLVADCEKTAKPRHSRCSMHIVRFTRHGDYNTVIEPSQRRHYKGDSVTYYGAHQRVKRGRGSASGYACVDCGETAAQWSFVPDRARLVKEGTAGSSAVNYSPDPQDYDPRCVGCHKTFDGGAR